MKKRNRKKYGVAATLLALCLCLNLSGSEVFATNADQNKTDTEEDTNETVEAELIKDKFQGSITLYRWEKVTESVSQLQKKVTEWTPVMMMADGSYISGKPKDCMYGSAYFTFMPDRMKEEIANGMMHSYSRKFQDFAPFSVLENIKGKEWFNKYIYIDSVAWRGEYTETRNGRTQHMMDVGTALMKINDKSYQYAGKDPQMKIDRSLFYTDDSRQVPSIRYMTPTNKEPGFRMRLMKADNKDEYEVGFTYGHDPKGNRSMGQLRVRRLEDDEIPPDIDVEQKGNTFRFGMRREQGKSYFTGDVWLKLTDDVMYAPCQDSTYFTCYLGTENHFSALNGNTVVNDGQIFTVSEADYVAGDGPEERDGKGSHTKGCFIPRGSTVTVNKGGVLSISGNLINNGTIINNGGTILIQKGGSISSFCAGNDIAKNGCGTIKCNSGDILIEKGGALYAGMNDDKGNVVPFYLDGSSTLINCGLMVYGRMKLSDSARVELMDGSKTVGRCFEGKTATEIGDNVVISDLDMDYDILSYYTDDIMKKDGIPSSCESLFRRGDFSGMYFDSGKSGATVLKTPKATLDDPKAVSQKMVTERADL